SVPCRAWPCPHHGPPGPLPSACMPTSSDTAAPDAEAEAERLYALDPEEFVAARDAAAKALRGDGGRARGAARRPGRRPAVTPPPWRPTPPSEQARTTMAHTR